MSSLARPSPALLLSIAASGIAAFAIAGCAPGASDTPSSAQRFTFVAPGGQDSIVYDPPVSRGQVVGLAGEDLADPGRTLRLEEFSGQVVVLNVWGSWCGPCRAEMPELQQVHRMFSSERVTVLGINVRDDRDAARNFLTSRSITYPNLFDQAGRSLLALAGFPRNTIPSTIVLDRRHRVAAVFLRAVRIGELVPIVRRVAGEEAPPPGGRDR